MNPLSFSQLAEWSGGSLTHGQKERMVTRVTTDSRTIRPGDLFVALVGDRFDGHNFLDDAFRQGAVAAMVSRELPSGTMGTGLGVIQVPDTLAGLQHLAGAYRQKLATRVVAVTGSNGKTSTKEFLAAILGELGRTTKTQGNLNNHIGVPLTLLQIDDSHGWAVVEMGMNHPGEIRPLVQMAQPEISLITQAGWAHIENFKDRESIAIEKGEVAYHLPEDGFAVLQGDNERLRALLPRIKVPVAWVGRGSSNEYPVGIDSMSGNGCRFHVTLGGKKESFSISIPGSHMVENAALAVVTGWKLGLDAEVMRKALAGVSLPKGRLALKPWEAGWLLDDTYNANPDSMAAAFRTLMSLPGGGRGVALLGCMGELGQRSGELHRWVGGDAAAVGLSCLHAVGPQAEDLVAGARAAGMTEATSWPDHASLAKGYLADRRAGDRVLVKGSRSATMEKVLPHLEI
jgi:UDP-N-acetylmuramoyl-tripeptide--D-alanyl-D-alanine ligase